MDDGWVGRRLMLASRALQERFVAHADAAGPVGDAAGRLAGTLLREVGRSIALSETDVRLPFARARGVLRLPPQEAPLAVAQAFNALGQLGREYLVHLPGATEIHRRFARGAVAHAARATLRLHRLLVGGGQDHEVERLFGGVAVLAFPAQPFAPDEPVPLPGP